MDISELNFPTAGLQIRSAGGAIMDIDLPDSRQMLALRMLQSLGVDLIQISDSDTNPVIIVGLGSGLVMATCDFILREYPYMSIYAADLSGSLGFERRCIALDYLGSSFPCVWVLWSSLRSLGDYAKYLYSRNFKAEYVTWLYCNGLGLESRFLFQRFQNVKLLNELWLPKCLGTDEEVCHIVGYAKVGTCIR